MGDNAVQLLKGKLRQFQDFPAKGILFEDILPIFADPIAFETLISAFAIHITQTHGSVDVIVGLDARGFLFGPTLALRLKAAFVPVRKEGKLPGRCVSATYEKEYGTDVFCCQYDAITTGQKVIIVDDIIATGGSAGAAGQIVKELGGQTIEYCFMLELDFLKGREKLVSLALTSRMSISMLT